MEEIVKTLDKQIAHPFTLQVIALTAVPTPAAAFGVSQVLFKLP